jgi:hypothetical protein
MKLLLLLQHLIFKCVGQLDLFFPVRLIYIATRMIADNVYHSLRSEENGKEVLLRVVCGPAESQCRSF